MSEKQCCGQVKDGIACDRWQHHLGPHRGYREEQDTVVFWFEQPMCGAVHESTGAHCELPPRHTQNHRGAFGHGTAQWPQREQ